MGEIVRHIERRDGISASEMKLIELCAEVKPMLLPMLSFLATATSTQIEERFNVKFGSGGIRQYYFALSQIINEVRPEFQPQGFEEWKSEITKDEQEKADKDAKWIQDRVHALVVDRLQAIYGAHFFDKGISSKDIKLKCHQKRMEEEPGDGAGGPERYLDFLDLRRIIEQKENWPYFEDIFNIKLSDQKKGLAKYIQWFDAINRIRRVSAHPYQRAYSKADLEIIRIVIDHLTPRITAPFAPVLETSS